MNLDEDGTQNVLAHNATADGDDGIIRVPISSNGKYSIKVTSEGHIQDSTEITVNCDLSQCGQCSPKVLVSLSPELPIGSARILLNWAEKPEDLDLYTYQINTEDTAQVCTTDYMNKSNCTGVNLDLDNRKGGDNGPETVTFSSTPNKSDFIYMIYVDDYSQKPQQFINSTARLTITDGIQTIKVPMKTQDYGRERYWLAGCLRLVGDTFEWKKVDTFLGNSPKDEAGDHCMGVFGIEKQTTTQEPGIFERIFGK